MDILMIGLSNAGKTTFVSTMYAALNNGYSDFTVRSTRPADHTRLKTSAEQIRKGVFPLPSDRRSIYSLQLCHMGNRVFDFNWRDYRGGALVESSSSPQAVQLREDMKNADGLVFMVDSTELLQTQQGRARLRPVIATAVRLLSECEVVIPVVLALTKWDLVASREKQAIEAAQALLGPLVDAVKATQHLLGAMIPVSCGANPRNVELPALWCLHVGIYVRGAILERNVEYYQKRIKVAESRSGIFDTIASAWRGEPTWRDIAQQTRDRLRNDLSLLQPLIAPSKRLEPLFTSTIQF
jgi:GTPase SAR1 family protein